MIEGFIDENFVAAIDIADGLKGSIEETLSMGLDQLI